MSLGQTIGQAGQAGMEAMRQSANDQLRQQQFGMQQQQFGMQQLLAQSQLSTADLARKKAEEDLARQRRLQQLLGGGGESQPAPNSQYSPGTMQAFGMDPAKSQPAQPTKSGLLAQSELLARNGFIEEAKKLADTANAITPQETFTFQADANIDGRQGPIAFGNRGTVNPIAGGAPKVDPNKPFNFGADGQMTPNAPYQEYERGLKIAGRPVQQTTVNMPKVEQSSLIAGNNDFTKEAYRPLMTAAAAAKSNNQQLSAIRSLPITERTGWGTEARAKAANVLAGLGVASKDIEQYAGDAQKFNAIVGQQIFTILGAQKGPQTEGDAQRATDTLTKLTNTAEANAYLLDLAEATNRLTIKQANFYNEKLPAARAAGDLTRVEADWLRAPENKSVFDDMVMKKWARRAEPARQSTSGTVNAAPAKTAPAGVDPQVWAVMTPEEQKLWK
jgi:hypothetical protein